MPRSQCTIDSSCVVALQHLNLLPKLSVLVSEISFFANMRSFSAATNTIREPLIFYLPNGLARDGSSIGGRPRRLLFFVLFLGAGASASG